MSLPFDAELLQLLVSLVFGTVTSSITLRRLNNQKQDRPLLLATLLFSIPLAMLSQQVGFTRLMVMVEIAFGFAVGVAILELISPTPNPVKE